MVINNNNNINTKDIYIIYCLKFQLKSLCIYIKKKNKKVFFIIVCNIYKYIVKNYI